MCGIFGVNSYSISKDHLKIFQQVGKLSESRGKEASGWAAFKDKEITTFKSPNTFSSKENLKTLREFKYSNKKPKWLIGHTRLKTHGEENISENNQPCRIDNDVLIHNGIITNYIDIINEFNLSNKRELDTFTIIGLIKLFTGKKNSNLINVLTQSIEKLKGEVSISGYSERFEQFYIYSNTGSIYYLSNNETIAVFASEYSIVEKANQTLDNSFKIKKLNQEECLIFDENGKISNTFNISTKGSESKYKNLNYIIKNIPKDVEIPQVERCSNCILPYTVPFIKFDKNNICNFCSEYKHHTLKPITELNKLINKKKIISGLSGGRDSSYGLLKLSDKFDVEIIAATYDWGMVTEIARRNQARVVGKLGIEHLWISADIVKKRKYIKKNLLAWLEKPHPGLIPVLMAGDKVWQKKLNLAKKETSSDFIVQFECPYEKTFFKYGFANVKPSFKTSYSRMNIYSNLKLFFFYVINIILNYRYWNLSIFDSIKGFYSFYFDKKDYIFPFDYLEFNEDEVNNRLSSEFQWEFDDTVSTSWRIGDGTAPFYNYLYYKYAGFTENDFFRSNQIREGLLTRESALKMVHLENQPREERIKEYLDYIDLNFEFIEKKLLKFFNNSKIKEWTKVNIDKI